MEEIVWRYRWKNTLKLPAGDFQIPRKASLHSDARIRSFIAIYSGPTEDDVIS